MLASVVLVRGAQMARSKNQATFEAYVTRIHWLHGGKTDGDGQIKTMRFQ